MEQKNLRRNTKKVLIDRRSQFNLRAFIEILMEGDYIETEDETHILKTYYLSHFLFDRFTRAHSQYTKETNSFLYFLSKDKPTNGK